jgi:hypothetical protein
MDAQKPSSDSLNLMGELPVPDDFELAGQTVTFDIGGVMRSFTFDEKGNAKGLKLSRPKTGLAKFALRLMRTDLGEDLSAAGVETDADIKNAEWEISVKILFNNAIYEESLPIHYSARKGRAAV